MRDANHGLAQTLDGPIGTNRAYGGPVDIGVYNYCDRWCERCTFQSACALNARLRGDPVDRAEPDPEPVEWPGWMLDVFNADPTPEEVAESERDLELRRALTRGHPAAQLAHRYLRHVRELAKAGGDQPAADPILSLAWESIQMLSLSISSKTARAIHEIIDRGLGEEWIDQALDPRGVMTDGNGSAKVALLMVTESREAWTNVACLDPGSQPRADLAIRLLDGLARELRTAFPHAMAFVRPGFDD